MKTRCIFALLGMLTLGLATGQAQTLIAQDDFTGATDNGNSTFTTNQMASNSNWASDVWTNGVNVDIRVGQEFSGTVIKLRNKDTFIARTIDLSTYDGTDIKISFKYGYIDLEGGEQLNVQFDSGDGNFATLDTIIAPTSNGSKQGLFDYDFTFTFLEIGSGLQAIRLSSSGISNPDSFFVDDVALTSVPEPTTFAMLLGGTGLLMLLRRRRG